MSLFKRADSWLAQHLPATRVMARLGTIASVLSGLAMAFHIGGTGGYALPLTGLLGAPSNLLAMRLLEAIHPIPRGVLHSAADWNIYLFLFSACVALNWTLFGFAADLLEMRPTPRPRSRVQETDTEALTAADIDPLVRELEDLERRVREPRRLDDGVSQRAA